MGWGIISRDAFSLAPPPRPDMNDEYYLPSQDGRDISGAMNVICTISSVVLFLAWVTSYPQQAGRFFIYLVVGAIALAYVLKAVQLGWYGLLRLALPALPHVRRALRFVLWPILKPMDILDAATERQRDALRERAAASADLAALRASFEAEFKRDLADDE